MSINAAAEPLSLGAACWHALVLGVVQGLTEFLPISSTAHLKVVPVLLGWGDPGIAFTAVIQLGSIAAVLAYFRRDLVAVGRGVARACRHGQWRDPSARLGVAIGLGTVPMMLGFSLLGPRLHTVLRFRLQRFIPASLAIVGVLLVLRGLALGIPYLSPASTAACH